MAENPKDKTVEMEAAARRQGRGTKQKKRISRTGTGAVDAGDS
jgi:hypothetical protein